MLYGFYYFSKRTWPRYQLNSAYVKKISLDLTRIKPIQYSTVVKSGDFLFIQTFNLKLLKLNKQNNCKTQKLSSYKNLKFCYWLKFHICPHTNYPQKAEIEDQGNKALLFHTSPVSFLFFYFSRQFSHLGTPETIRRMSTSSPPKDFWDCLGRPCKQWLVNGYPRIPSTNHNYKPNIERFHVMSAI